MDAIVPAHNEEPTVAAVVQVLVASRCFGRVLVVDDGSSDGTADAAAAAGATVLSLSPNRGKGQAMLEGLRESGPGDAAFFDADLLDLETRHVERLVGCFQMGFDMACGVRDYGLFGNPTQMTGPLITGERCIRRWVLDRVHPSCWKGFGIETALNHACLDALGRIGIVLFDGVSIRQKTSKLGLWGGIKGYMKMAAEIQRCEQALAEGGTCDPA